MSCVFRSHCAGIGEPLPIETTRRILALRINVLAKAFSGCNPGLVEHMVEMFNKNCLPLIPGLLSVLVSGNSSTTYSKLLKIPLSVKLI